METVSVNVPDTSPGTEPSPGLARARALLEADKLHEAVDALEALNDPSPAAAALLGAAYFRLEEYGKAANILRRVSDRSLRPLYERALANEAADVRRHVPEPIYLDKTPPKVSPQPGPHLGVNPARALPTSTIKRALRALGSVAGVKVGETLKVLTELLGREPASKSKWTTWYTHEFVRAMIMLAHRRERLNKEQLFAAYPRREGTGFFRSSGTMPAWVRSARTPDGSWNDLEDPLAGSSGVRFGFNTDPSQTKAETGERLLTPNPRTVSRVLLTRKEGFKAIPFLNLTAASWIQFMNHDWVSYGDPDVHAEPYRIPLDADDPARRALHQTHMIVRPTQQDPTKRTGETAPTHINEVTSWWDASQIYGSDAKTVDALRSHVGGKLAVDPKTGNLPVLPDGVEHTGFRRNWWLGLAMLHTLFVKEHNAICDMLAARYPKLSDQRLFDTARLINAAVLAKIHTVEWTPAVLPNEALHAAMNANWYGALTNLLRAKKTRKTLADINVADPVAGGLVGNKT
ncbi:MAG TPA: peroxidase family protein, partial [Polyangiales bacterium]|nr:peroxidase family protein [Polyangiales bacterium]